MIFKKQIEITVGSSLTPREYLQLWEKGNDDERTLARVVRALVKGACDEAYYAGCKDTREELRNEPAA